MLPNLILNTGINMVNVSQKVTSDIIVPNPTTGTTALINQLTINLNKPTNKVLLSGVVDAIIADSAAGVTNPILGPISLEILKPVNGIDTIIYKSTFSLNDITFLATVEVPYKFSFQWVDSNIAATACPNMCSENINNCPVNAITYTFKLAALSGARPTLSGRIPTDSYYSLTAMEIPQ